MFMVNRCGEIGAFAGYHQLNIIKPEWPPNNYIKCPYLKVSRWLYPLIRSCSFIYCWKRDRIIILEPFSHVLYPRYIVIRLPFQMTKEQSASLWNLLDANAQVQGKFSYMDEDNETNSYDVKLNPNDEFRLSNAPPNANAKDLKVKKPHNFSQPVGSSSASGLSVGLRSLKKPGSSQRETGPVYVDKGNKKGHRIVPSLTRRNEQMKREPEANEGMANGGTSNNAQTWVIDKRCLQRYTRGPRYGLFVEVNTTPTYVSVPYNVVLAVESIHNVLVKKASLREEKGIPNPFGIQAVPLTLSQNSQLRDLKRAAAYFDKMLLKKEFTILRFEPDNRLSPCKVVSPLIPVPLISDIECCRPPIDTLMVLSAFASSDYIYSETKNPPKRVLEDCDHHYPKAGPSNANFHSAS